MLFRVPFQVLATCDDGTALTQCLALFFRETVKSAGLELRIEHHIHTVIIHADECEAGAGMDFLSVFVGDTDGKYRRTTAVKDVLGSLLWQVFEHLLCQPESFEDAVWQFLALKSLDLHLCNFMGCHLRKIIRAVPNMSNI